MRKTINGFTIVELLIVIVVIAILAAISMVAYIGIQNRGYDVAVQSDLSNFAKKAALYHAQHEHYPAVAAELADLQIRTSKNAYDTTAVLNFSYCATSNGSNYAIGGISKSGRRFFVSSQSAVTEYSSSLMNDGNASDLRLTCSDLLAGTNRIQAGFYGSWRPWTGN